MIREVWKWCFQSVPNRRLPSCPAPSLEVTILKNFLLLEIPKDIKVDRII